MELPLDDSAVSTAFLILCLGLLPPVASLWFMRQAEGRSRTRLQSAINTALVQRFPTQRSSSGYYVEGLGYQIGDITCQFNARSAYIRCAVNPTGPCQECPHYRSIEFT